MTPGSPKLDTHSPCSMPGQTNSPLGAQSPSPDAKQPGWEGEWARGLKGLVAKPDDPAPISPRTAAPPGMNE